MGMTRNNHQVLIIELVTYDFCVQKKNEKVSNQYNNHSNFDIYFIIKLCKNVQSNDENVT